MKVRLRSAAKAARMLAVAISLAGVLLATAQLPAATATEAPMRWNAEWIWPCTAAIATHDNQFILFRKTFTITNSPQEAHLAIFADSRYRLYINGAYIGQGPSRAPHYWYYYDAFNVASDLRPGKNVIAVEVRWYGEGMAWYEMPRGGRLGFGPKPHGALLCQLDIGHGASEQIIKTDSSWRATEDHAWDWDTPRMNFSLANIEVYHADRVVKDWKSPDFDDSGWIPVSVRRSPIGGLPTPPAAPYAHLVPRPMAYPVEREILPAKVAAAGLIVATPRQRSSFMRRNPLANLGKEIAAEKHEVRASVLQNARALTSLSSEGYAEVQPVAGRDPYVILDMGREVDGYLQFRVESEKRAEITIAWSEMMEHGDITADDPGGSYVAEYDVAPGTQHWTMWGWHGLRFVEMSFHHLSAPVRFRVKMRFSTAKLSHAGSFKSSSPLLTKLWQMGAYTWQLCTLDGTMDCPTREQHQWLADGEIELRVNGVADGTLDIARKFLLDASRDQWRDGAIPMVSDMGGNNTMLIDSYIFSFVNALQAYYEETGDVKFVQRLYPSVARAMMWFQDLRQPEGLLGTVPYWNFLDWSNPDSKGESSILNSLYAHTLDDATQLANLAGDHYHATIFREDSARIHALYNQRFWNPRAGLYVDAWDKGA
jgi:alpha-L-rhamnosidase